MPEFLSLGGKWVGKPKEVNKLEEKVIPVVKKVVKKTVKKVVKEEVK